MASRKEYLDFILEQLSGLDEISYRAMMGEYIIYYRGRIVGGIYDDRFMVKPTKSAAAMMLDADRELPYLLSMLVIWRNWTNCENSWKRSRSADRAHL